ncbi:MAG: YraN family protein [Deltaproteobacteria bacterium]|nr:YraN family protein [Deltaproteobacteria bacterium]MBI2500259.1 YraN family protein [Deltaproteobacteria bacterium]
MQPDFLKKKLGREGEEEAVQFLKNRGFQIRERNYRCRLGEIDLIAEKEKALYFVEVKSRRSLEGVSPYELVPYPKQLHISRVAQQYYASKKIVDQAGSFALIIVDFEKTPPFCEWVPDLFLLQWGY